MGLDRIPEPLRSEVLAGQAINQKLVLGYWDGLLRAPADELQAVIEGEMSRVSAPGLLVFGRALKRASGRISTSHIPWATVEEWVGDGHCLHLVEPDRFAERLRAFVAACD